jgi:hypothetical protein
MIRARRPGVFHPLGQALLCCLAQCLLEPPDRESIAVTLADHCQGDGAIPASSSQLVNGVRQRMIGRVGVRLFRGEC